MDWYGQGQICVDLNGLVQIDVDWYRQGEFGWIGMDRYKWVWLEMDWYGFRQICLDWCQLEWIWIVWYGLR